MPHLLRSAARTGEIRLCHQPFLRREGAPLTMKSNVERINPVQYRVSIEVEPSEVNKAFEGAYRNLEKKARIQGFRPGKAPLNVIRRLYGGSVAGEVHEKLINTHLFSALNTDSIRPIAS